MRRLPSLRRRGSWGWVGADWWGEVAIALGPSSRGCGAQRPRMASCFTGLEAEQNDALHNGADGLTWRARGAVRAPGWTQGHFDTFFIPPLTCRKIGRASCRERVGQYV